MCGVFNKVRRSETDYLNTLKEVRRTVCVFMLELNLGITSAVAAELFKLQRAVQ